MWPTCDLISVHCVHVISLHRASIFIKLLRNRCKMAVTSGVSFMLSATLAVVTFAGMQMFRTQLASTEWMTILGGFIGSVLFCLTLTALGNFFALTFGKSYQMKILPEVGLCLGAACFASGLVHRVCITTCFLFSLVAMYYLNKISGAKYAPPPQVVSTGKRKK